MTRKELMADSTQYCCYCGCEVNARSYTYVQRLDWLVSGDDGEEDFHTRLRKELKEKHMSGDHNMNQHRHKPWVGLTEEEVGQIIDGNTLGSCYQFWCSGKGVAEGVEAKLKEKNT